MAIAVSHVTLTVCHVNADPDMCKKYMECSYLTLKVALSMQKFYGHKNVTTVKPVLSSNSKQYKTKILMTNGSLRKDRVLENAPLVHSAFLLTCINW